MQIASKRSLFLGVFCSFLLFVICPAVIIPAQAAATPVLFFSDLDSGPNTGGENNNGAYVTLYGSNLGSNPTVTVGGGSVLVKLQPASWMGYQKMIIQLGPNAVTGNIVLSNSNGTSNGLPFTVRSGNIYFVSTSGSDSNTGSFASPWASISHAQKTILAGDIAYARNGVSQNVDDGGGWNACLTFNGNTGAAGNPKTLAAYPGETATIGNVLGDAQGGCDFGMRGTGAGENYWTITNFTIRGQGIALGTYSSKGWRIIGNDISCPNGNAQAGCVDVAYTTSFFIYGNNIHNTGTNLSPGTVTALYHGVYISEQAAGIDFGWNTIAYVQGCRGLQQNVNAGAPVYGLLVHDNVIHDTQCDGIIADKMDPSKGTVAFYNNVIYNAGLGPNNAEGTGAWTCMNLQDWDSGGTGVIQVYNNTMYNCGSFPNPPYAGSSAGFLWESDNNPPITANLRNNIIDQTTNVPYIVVSAINNEPSCTSNCPEITGSSNLFFGNGAPLTNNQLTTNLNQDPLFNNPANADFTFQPGSPALGAGINTGICSDGSGWDIGACSASASIGTLPPPPSPSISLSSTTLFFSGTPGGSNPANQTFSVSNGASNGSTLNWSGSPNQPWLALAPNTGGNGPTPVTVSVNTAGLAVGGYSGTLTFIDPNATNNPQTVMINLMLTGRSGGGGTSLPTIDANDLPGYTGINDSLSITNYPDSNVSFVWTFVANGSLGATSDAPMLRSSAAQSASFSSGVTTQSLASYGLTLGTYQVTVQAVDTSGNTSPMLTATITLVESDFSAVRVYPNPWRSDKGYPASMTFDQMPLGSTVKIFTVSGHKVRTLTANIDTAIWDLANDSGDKVASGIYIYLITDSQGDKTKGKLAVIK